MAHCVDVPVSTPSFSPLSGRTMSSNPGHDRDINMRDIDQDIAHQFERKLHIQDKTDALVRPLLSRPRTSCLSLTRYEISISEESLFLI